MTRVLGSYDEMLLKRLTVHAFGLHVEAANYRQRHALQRLAQWGLVVRNGDWWVLTADGRKAVPS